MNDQAKILTIRISGEPVLHKVAETVTNFSAIEAIANDMFATMEAAPGVGLAAPQVGLGLQLFVYRWEADDQLYEGVAVNPQLSISAYREDELDIEEEVEGCLSFPGPRFPLRRADRAVLKAQDVNGESYEIEAEGWLARIFQHEFDHLQGTLYVDRLTEPYHSQAKKLARKRGWGKPGKFWTPGQDSVDP